MKKTAFFVLSSIMVFSLLFGNIFNFTKAEASEFFRTELGNKIALKSVENGKFVSADNNGNSPLIANRDQVGRWETFRVVHLGHNKIALKSEENGKFVSADNNGNSPLIANRDQIGRWEAFEVVHLSHNKIALKSVENGKFVCADNNGNSPLIANRDQVGRWETFEVAEFD